MNLDEERISSPRQMMLHRVEDEGEELGETGGGKEDDRFSSSDASVFGGLASVEKLVVRDKTENMDDLVLGGGKDGVILGNVEMGVDVVFSDRIDKDVILLHALPGDLANLFRHGGGEEEGLAIGVFGEMFRNGCDIVGESHVEESIGFVEDEHSGVGESVADHTLGLDEINAATGRGDDDVVRGRTVPFPELHASRSSSDE